MEKCNVIFYPYRKRIETDYGANLLEIAQKAGIYVNSVCGGDGICGKCKLLIIHGKVKTESTSFLTREEIQKGYVLACLTQIQGNLKVEVPIQSRLEKEQILVTGKIPFHYEIYEKVEKIESLQELEEKQLFVHSPLATKLFLKMPQPTLEDNISDLERLYREVRRGFEIPILQTGLANVKKLGAVFRANNFEVTVTLGKRNGTVEIVQIEPANTENRNFGVAIDVGTTTVVAQLVDLNTEKILSTDATYNKQITYGEDVISRIIYANEKDGLEKLNQAVIENINSLIANLVKESGIKLNEIMAVICAGNMTMTQLLLGVDPSYLRREPYVPTANFMPVIRAAEVGIKINPRGLLACLPGVGSYVGGDITAGVLACGMNELENISLLIDMGTNGEIVLGNKDWLICCSSSAGPAFEGGGIKCGIRATKGAIQRVEINNNEVSFQTIGDAKPIGICGAGIIDLLSEMLRTGIIDKAGKIKIKNSRIREIDGVTEFIVAFNKETEIGQDIVITETDIINLLRSKAAVYAATSVLIEHMKIKKEEISHIFVAGGFGNYLNIEKAIFIGLLLDLPLQKYKFIGNSSVTGARLSLLSMDAYNKVKFIANKMTGFELSVDTKFMDEYIKAMFLPHTDFNLFPSVKEKLK